MKTVKAQKKKKALKYDAYIVIRAKVELRERLEALAKRERRTFAEMTRILLEDAVAEMERR